MYTHLIVVGLLLSFMVGGILAAILSQVLGKRAKTSAVKEAAYECGLAENNDWSRNIPVVHYPFAILFVLFDLEVVFLYTWAVAYKHVSREVLAEFNLIAFGFMGILGVACIYLIRKFSAHRLVTTSVVSE